MEERGNNSIEPPRQQQEDDHQLDSTVNDLVDQFGDTGVEEGEFPQARDDDYPLHGRHLVLTKQIKQPP
jgi:hypothetical protein